MHTAYIQPPGAPPVKVCYIVTYKSCHILGALRTYRIFDHTETQTTTKTDCIEEKITFLYAVNHSKLNDKITILTSSLAQVNEVVF